MKVIKQSTPFIIFLIVLLIAQFACSAGSKLLNNNSQNSTQAPASTVASSGGATQIASTSESSVVPTTAATQSAHGTPDQAKAMLQLAIQHYQSVGRDQALKDFTNRVAPFFDRDLYVACIDSHLIQSANGGFPNLVGSSVEPLGKARWDAATTGKIDSISYSYIDPVTKVNTPKTFYYEKVGTDVCGVGAYQP